MTRRGKTALFIATGGGAGFAPAAPGTFGSLAALPLCFLLACWPWLPALLCLCLLIVAAVWSAGVAEGLLTRKDPSCIVIDEIAGMAVTLFGLPFNLSTAVAGFLLFRLLDITKPFPVGYLDRRISGGLGVVMDDLAAGLLGNLLLRVLLWVVGI